MSIEEKLITLVRENEFLYNRELSDYRNNALKDKKWREIAATLRVDVLKAKQRWKSLRDRFMREQTRIKILGESGKKTVITWKYFRPLQFLKSHAKRRSLFKDEGEGDNDFSEQNENTEMYDATTMDEQQISYNDQGNTFQLPTLEVKQAGNSHYSSVSSPTQKRKGNVKELLSEKIEEQIKRLITHMVKGQERQHPQTPAQAFFHAMAIQVEHANLPMPTWFALQQEIMQLINNTITALNPE